MSVIRAIQKPHWKPLEIVFWLLPAAVYFLLPNYLVLASQIMITGLFALSVDLILGYAGVISLGHAAFFGIGAFAAGLMATHGMGDPLLGLAVAALAAAAVGLLTSFLVIRGHDLTRLMVTLGIGLLLYELANEVPSVTGGTDGLQGMEVKPLLGLFSFGLTGRVAFLYAWAVLFVMFYIARRLINSPFGWSLRGIRENARRMPLLGTSIKKRLVVIYTVAAAFAGVAGALLAETTQFVSLDSLSFQRSADVMIMLILGGAGRLYGGLIGAAFFMVAHEYFSDLNPQYWEFWMGVLLVAVILFARGGILGAAARLKQRFGGEGK